MDFSRKYLNIIFKRQKLLEFLTILAILFAIGFRFGSEGSEWFWNDFPFIAMLLVMVGLLLSMLWVRIEKHKTQIILDEIKNSGKKDTDIINDKVNLLTNRQREIFDLIIKGKSNQEIMDDLFIELSTLKTHINHIYKTLEIANRKEARAMGRVLKNNNPD